MKIGSSRCDTSQQHKAFCPLPITSEIMYNGPIQKALGDRRMERLTFKDNSDSAQRLEEIMYSYQGWSGGTVMSDMRSLSLLLFLLEQGEIVITEHIFPFDSNIRDDNETMAVYSALASQTRWKQFAHTEVEGIRMNALKQMRQR